MIILRHPDPIRHRPAGTLVGPHRDAFDRMLTVQAQAEGVPIARNETILDHYGVTRLW